MSYDTVLADAVANWPLQEQSGSTAADATGNGHDGALESSLSFDANKVAGPTWWLPSALRSPGGTNARCVVPDHPDLRGGGQMTIAFWLDMSDTNNSSPIFTKWLSVSTKDWGTRRNNNAVEWTSENGNVDYAAAAVPLNGVWSHVAMQYDNTSGVTQTFLNGILAAANTSANHSASTGADVVLFGHNYKTSATVASLAGVQFFDRILSPSEVAELAAGPSAEVAYRQHSHFIGA